MYCMHAKVIRKPTISLRLPPGLLEDVDDLVARSRMRSRTDFIEKAVEAYVQEMKDSKVVVLRPWTDRKAKAAVMKFLQDRSTARLSEIIEALGMDPNLAFRTVEALAGEEKIE
jgi:metal-responsive CopG/Arc/MetJ family transcriptional regulator